MGANQSNLTNQPITDDSISAKLFSRHGFQILRVHPNSPVSEANVSPYFDYIIAINGVEVSPDIPNIISEMARNHVNKPLKLNIYNSRQDEERQVTIVPRTGWGGDGLLGCAIRFSPLDGVRDRSWHILKVHDKSPAQKAGLIATDDYVIASPDLLLRSEDEFYQLITQNTRRPVKLIVFNVEKDELREIEIVPDFEWGGEGCMGCDVGSGMVHWIPPKKSYEKVEAVVETQNNIAAPPAPLSSSFPVQAPQSLLQSQSQYSYTAQPQPSVSSFSSSLLDSPSKISPVVSVHVPASRPVIDFLGEPANTTAVPVLTAAMPPPMTQFHHQPHSAQSQVNGIVMDDDIPMPNFTVPSDIIHQH